MSPAAAASVVASLAVAVGTLSPLPVAAQKAPAKGKTRQIFVGVVDRGGAPVLDLQPSDFDVKENGVKRDVVRARLSTSPMRIAVFVDTSDAANAALNPIRSALTEFFDTLPPEHEAMLVSTGRQMRIRVQPTTDRKKLKDAASGLFMDGGGTQLMEGVLEVDDRFMKKAEDRWPVFVILTTDGAESSPLGRENEFNKWLQALAPRGLTVHAIVLKQTANQQDRRSGTTGVPEILAMNMTQGSGGRYDYVNTATSVPEKMKNLAAALASDFNAARTRYQVEFASDAAASAPVDVGVAREGVTLRIMQTRLR
ncbi:MAG TPA: VWA domain-containing protein [Vicinamibacterales bacterium]|nr:VWA domain-containing protein [Vicinamibacterales bacterium]